MRPEDKGPKRPGVFDLNGEINRLIEQNRLGAIGDSFSIEHPGTSRVSIEKGLWQNRRRKRSIRIGKLKTPWIRKLPK